MKPCAKCCVNSVSLYLHVSWCGNYIRSTGRLCYQGEWPRLKGTIFWPSALLSLALTANVSNTGGTEPVFPLLPRMSSHSSQPSVWDNRCAPRSSPPRTSSCATGIIIPNLETREGSSDQLSNLREFIQLSREQVMVGKGRYKPNGWLQNKQGRLGHLRQRKQLGQKYEQMCLIENSRGICTVE